MFLYTGRYDREGSVASTASLPNTLGPMKLSNQVLNESSTLTPHVSIQYLDRVSRPQNAYLILLPTIIDFVRHPSIFKMI